MKTIAPTDVQIEQLKQMSFDPSPVTVVHLLCYRDMADYSEYPDFEPCSGRDAYRRYARIIYPLLDRLKAKPLLKLNVNLIFVGPTEERWDDVSMVEWPNISAFRQLIEMEEYQSVVFHRRAAVANSRILISQRQF